MPLPGGSSDKLGNRYELWWTVTQLQRMLHGKIISIRIEKPGLDDAEFVAHVDGHQEFHQSKRSHHSGNWTISSLAATDCQVLQAIFTQLHENNDRFVFVSASHAGELDELALRARNAQTAQEFNTECLKANRVKTHFGKLQKAWKSCTGEIAWELLRRITVRSIDEQSLAEIALVGAQALFLADPQAVCSELRAIALDSVHQTITRDDLIERLKRRGLILRRLSDSAHAIAVIREATTRYLEDARRRLIRNVLIHRASTDTLLSKLGTTAGDSVVTGKAGTGKTGCLVEFVEQLLTRSIPVLAIRLDRIEPVSTASELGTKLGFEESPALILAAAAQGQESVLVIDQLDAASTTSGRATSFLEVIEGLLIEARGLRARLPLHVIVACREFDWNNDHRLRTMLPKDHTRVDVGEFTFAEVSETLTAEGFDPTRFQPSQMKLLRLPQNLSLFLGSGFDRARPPVFNTAIDLFDEYWKEKQRAVARRASPASDYWAKVIRVLVEAMATTQQLSVPREMLDDFPHDYIEQMASEGVLSLDGRRYAFGHESFFDYCFARFFFGADQSLVPLLTSSEQHLFRRAQVRQVLTYLRGANRDRYLREMQDLLSHTTIRPHLKNLTFALLADVPDPSDKEWAIWEQNLSPFFTAVAESRGSGDKLSNMAWQRFFGSRAWFRYAVEHGFVKEWLLSGDQMVDTAIQYVRSHQRHSPDLVVDLLEPFIGVGGTWPTRLRHVVQWSDPSASRRFFEFLLLLIDIGTLDEARAPIASNSSFWSMFYGLSKERPEWIPEVLAHWLKRRFAVAQLSSTNITHDPLFDGDQFADKPIDAAASNSPAMFVQYVLPIALEISDCATDPAHEAPRRDRVWPCLFNNTHHTKPSAAIFEGLKTSLCLLANDLACDLSSVISQLRIRETYMANSLLLTLYAANGARFSDEAASLLSEERWRFECGYADSTYWTATEVIRAIFPHCSAESRTRLEEAILKYSSAFERSQRGYKLAGSACFNLLSAIPGELRSPTADGRFRELERKFQNPYAAPRGISGGWVVSPIESKAASRMTDEQWLGAIRKYRTEHREFRQVDDLLMGGAIELARQLQTYVEQEPERFASLALRFPADTNGVYCEHVLYGLKKAAIPSDLKLDVCRKAYADCREECGGAIADLLGSIEDPLPDDAIAMLDWLVNEHPDPQVEHWQTQAGDDNPHYGGDIYTNGINTTRGKAAEAIANLVLKDPAYIKNFDATLARMIQDPSSAVLSCVARTIRAVTHHDAELGLSLLSQMKVAEDALLATHHVEALIGSAIVGHFQQVRHLVERMLRSREPVVAKSGARLAALSFLYQPEAEKLEAEAFAGNASQRLGVAQVAAENICSEHHRFWCQNRLVSLFNDEDEAVRQEAAMAFRYLEHSDLEEYADLIQAFCDSEAFCDDSFSILNVLTESVRRLPGMTCNVCEKFLERFSDEARDIRTSRMGDAYTVVTLLFRIYQQHQQDEWSAKALNLIDRLCLEGIGNVDDTFQAFER